eukprot:1681292-Rhodomonas_salina.1
MLVHCCPAPSDACLPSVHVDEVTPDGTIRSADLLGDVGISVIVEVGSGAGFLRVSDVAPDSSAEASVPSRPIAVMLVEVADEDRKAQPGTERCVSVVSGNQCLRLCAVLQGWLVLTREREVCVQIGRCEARRHRDLSGRDGPDRHRGCAPRLHQGSKLPTRHCSASLVSIFSSSCRSLCLLSE